MPAALKREGRMGCQNGSRADLPRAIPVQADAAGAASKAIDA